VTVGNFNRSDYGNFDEISQESRILNKSGMVTNNGTPFKRARCRPCAANHRINKQDNGLGGIRMFWAILAGNGSYYPIGGPAEGAFSERKAQTGVWINRLRKFTLGILLR
jgi:hypothetical protein